MPRIGKNLCISGVVVLFLMIIVSSCGAGPEVNQDDSSGVAAASQIDEAFSRDQGVKIASSFDEYIEQIREGIKQDRELRRLDITGDALKRKMEIIDEVQHEGIMSAHDYESIWTNYRQCMLDRGYREIILLRQINGTYIEARHRIGTDSQETKYQKDMMECGILNTTYLNDLYKNQQGNLGLFKNPYEGALDCMHRNEYVPREYSLDDLKHDLYEASAKTKLHADIYGQEIPSCLIANNIAVFPDDSPLERLW